MRSLLINEMIAKSFQQHSENIAIEHNEGKVTYGKLQEHIMLICDAIKGKTVSGRRMVILLNRSIALIEVILAAVDLDIVFAPLDPEIPEKRLAHLISEITPDWIITSSQYIEKIEKISLYNRTINEFNVIGTKIILNCKMINSMEIKISSTIKSADNCYIYFTSGSTGIPKGIVGRNSSLAQFVKWETSELGINEKYRFSQLTPPTFDPFLRDIFVPLCAGGCICIPDSAIIADSRKLKKWVVDNEINVIHMVPSLFKSFTTYINDKEYFEHLKYVLLAGELLKGSDLIDFYQKCKSNVQLINLYGPSETTLARFFYRIKEGDVKKNRIPAGKSIGYTKAYLFREDMSLCKQEEIGEIYISTPFASNGYLNDEKLTNQMFLDDLEGRQDHKMFKTGDTGTISFDGNLEVIGRVDHQIKIRGMKLQPEEVEVAMIEIAEIKNAVVFELESDIYNTKVLVACVESESHIDQQGVKKFLSKSLPDYMIPADIIAIENMPKNRNGKVDRKAVKELANDIVLMRVNDSTKSSEEATFDMTEVQKRILKIITSDFNEKLLDILSLDTRLVSIGFDSINFIKTIITLEAEFGFEFDDAMIFISKFPTIRTMVDYVEKKISESDENA